MKVPGDSPIDKGEGRTVYPGLACPHCGASFFKQEKHISHIEQDHPGKPYAHAAEDDKHKIEYFPNFTNAHPHFYVLSDKKSGQYLSNMTLDHDGTVLGVETHPKYRNQGHAKALWDYATENAKTGAPAPKHSSSRTAAGEAWAKKVGGELPKRAGNYVSAGQMRGMLDFGRGE